MYCPQCGKERSDGQKFCANCGANIELVAPKHAIPVASGVGDPMTFGKSISTCFSKFFDFKGRASRSEYWWFCLFANVVGFGSILVVKTPVLYLLINTVLSIPVLSAGARRLHDTNRSGWWQLLYMTVIGTIPVVVWMASKPSVQVSASGSTAAA